MDTGWKWPGSIDAICRKIARTARSNDNGDNNRSVLRAKTTVWVSGSTLVFSAADKRKKSKLALRNGLKNSNFIVVLSSHSSTMSDAAVAESVTEAEAGVNLDIPASVKIKSSLTPKVSKTSRGFSTRFKFFKAARIRTSRGERSYTRNGPGTSVSLKAYTTEKAAQDNMYRDIYRYVIAKSPQGSPEAVRKKKEKRKMAEAVQARDERAVAREIQKDPAAAKTMKDQQDEARAADVAKRMRQTLNQKAKLRKRKLKSRSSSTASSDSTPVRKARKKQPAKRLATLRKKLSEAREELEQGIKEMGNLKAALHGILSAQNGLHLLRGPGCGR